MLRYLFYPAFGLIVLGGYATVARSAFDAASPGVRRGSVPAGYRAGNLSAAPIIWYTGFHGPAAYRPRTSSGGGYVGGYGGYGGGK